jgi:mRNA interferase HicA
MKRIDLIRHIEQSGCRFHREGGNHSIYTNPGAGKTAAIPRHREIKTPVARKICRDLGVPQPPIG